MTWRSNINQSLREATDTGMASIEVTQVGKQIPLTSLADCSLPKLSGIREFHFIFFFEKKFPSSS